MWKTESHRIFLCKVINLVYQTFHSFEHTNIPTPSPNRYSLQAMSPSTATVISHRLLFFYFISYRKYIYLPFHWVSVNSLISLSLSCKRVHLVPCSHRDSKFPLPRHWNWLTHERWGNWRAGSTKHTIILISVKLEKGNAKENMMLEPMLESYISAGSEFGGERLLAKKSRRLQAPRKSRE